METRLASLWRRPPRFKRANATLADDVRYYVDWVHEVAFPETAVVWIVSCSCGDEIAAGIDEALELLREKKWAVVLDKRFLCDTKPKRLHAGHGCSGPVLNVLARMVFRMMEIVDARTTFSDD